MAIKEEFKLEIPDKLGSPPLAIEDVANHPMAG